MNFSAQQLWGKLRSTLIKELTFTRIRNAAAAAGVPVQEMLQFSQRDGVSKDMLMTVVEGAFVKMDQRGQIDFVIDFVNQALAEHPFMAESVLPILERCGLQIEPSSNTVMLGGRSPQMHLTKEASDMPTASSLEVFISHSGKDGDFAEALIELLRAAIDIPHQKIRCTSVDGYRLPAGVPTDTQLKHEVRDSSCFIALLTPTSLKSAYVLFELGARWGAQLSLFPLMAKGIEPAALEGPLSSINALSCGSGSQLHQFVSEVAGVLGRSLNTAATYDRYLQRLIAMERAAASEEQTVQAPVASSEANTTIISAEAKTLMELVMQEKDPDKRGLVEIIRGFIPGQTDFFPSIQYSGSPANMKARKFREAIAELVNTGWLYPPEEDDSGSTRTYEYRGDTSK